MVILDTDHLSILERGGGGSLKLQMRLDRIPVNEIATTIVNYEEQMRGWLALASAARTAPKLIQAYEKLHDHIRTFAGVIILPIDSAAAVHLQRLHDTRVRIGTMDRRIAAIALVNDATVLTRNTSDFEKVPGLRFEDWTI